MPTKGKRMSTAGENAPDADLLRVYLNEIGKHELLTREDEQRIGEVIDAGRQATAMLAEAGADDLPAAELARLRARADAGQEAEKAFVEANLRLVVSIAKR